jgi:glutamyl-Q tRNA(Asp) synthetase
MPNSQTRTTAAPTSLPADPVVGRFAPSPTGPLHFGSLVAALGSFLSARRHGGRWLLRIDDLDPPREMAGAADTILHQLERYALHWDGEVMYQSTRSDAYAAALAALDDQALLYRCGCRRKAWKAIASSGIDGLVYPGTCRELGLGPEQRCSRRFNIGTGAHTFLDQIRGSQVGDRATDLGDFILQRSDGLYAYPLAAAIDDHAQAVTEVVRGSDLLPGTHRQSIVLRALDLEPPGYAHLPMVLDSSGNKLSKRDGATMLSAVEAVDELIQALKILGQIGADEPLGRDDFEGPTALLSWAAARWDLACVPAEDHRLPD